MFLTLNNKTVNTDTVHNIAFEDRKRKIIFNFEYGVSMRDDSDKIISDYVYFLFDNDEDFENTKSKLTALNGWISSGVDYINRIVNSKKISFMTSDKYNNRVIFNLTSSVSFTKDKYSRSSDFVWWTYKSPSEMIEHYDRIKEDLGV